nr:MAG TPA: hypothetical protein [Caudoviricetes sp.]
MKIFNKRAGIILNYTEEEAKHLLENYADVYEAVDENGTPVPAEPAVAPAEPAVAPAEPEVEDTAEDFTHYEEAGDYIEQ